MSLSPSEEAELLALLTLEDQQRPPKLSEFVERTTGHTLDPWQHILCDRLERLAYEVGQRILIHAPPQWGKSSIISERFPAWLLGIKPLHRVKLACYNISHATDFSKVVRDTMRLSEYEEMFPNPECRLPSVTSEKKWSTVAREALASSQPSFKPLGLVTGFVGEGADTLIVDDPYASPQDAMSEAVRASTWMFWEASAKVRLTAESNVVVMFHRYHMEDLGGRLIADGMNDGRPWEILRFAAEADGLGDDPTGREVGELLSPRMSRQIIEEQKKSPRIWLGQFQGTPLPPGGGMFKRDWFDGDRIVDGIPLNPDGSLPAVRRVRRWDMAATDAGGDYTVGLRMAECNGIYYVEDVVRGQWSPDARDRKIVETAHRDKKEVGDMEVGGPQDPGAAGKSQALAFVRMLAGFRVYTESETGNKVVRAGPFASQADAGNVRLVRGDWNETFLSEMTTFPYGGHDDIVDTCSGAFNRLVETSNTYRIRSLN